MYEELKDKIKALKCNCFKIYDNRIMGLDSNLFPIPAISIIYGDFSLYEKGMYYINSKTEIFKYNLTFPSKEEYILDTFIIPNRDFAIESFLIKEKGSDIPCLENKKSADGLCVHIVDNYVFSLFKGLIPYTKQDVCNVYMYSSIENGSLVEYELIKSKFTLYKYIQYLHV